MKNKRKKYIHAQQIANFFSFMPVSKMVKLQDT